MSFEAGYKKSAVICAALFCGGFFKLTFYQGDVFPKLIFL
jgi:hypothetical protein